MVNTFSPGTYTVSETNQPGYTATISGNCSASGSVTLAAGENKVCTITNNDVPPVITTGCTSNCGGGGGGGGPSKPKVVLSSVPHVGQVLGSYLYLSQIPYTGLELGPIGTTLYWLALIGWALALAYLVLFGAVPFASRSARSFGTRVSNALNAQELRTAPAWVPEPAPAVMPEPHEARRRTESVVGEAPRGYSSYEGFKSFAKNGALSIDDIVKGLARSHSPVPPAPTPFGSELRPQASRVYANVEPIYENVEPITADTARDTVPVSAPAHIRGFTAALVEGDREAVFAGLRQHVRGGGMPEKLVSEVVCLLDDAYRARVDGTACDADMARLVARLNTPTLEKLIAALTNAIDSSYSTGVTGAKLALTRALATLGA
ncbi:hypothetical protein A3C19_03405 [Candidatus Kaiserbacteria bacterium RIFCSPHIGHO2_02_FULL_54_22]|uniref:Uncharacterized protein n=1 Tax=Candidatus Kaiserbacteria bacterium RIFCSPHIGHO2_02_FULL_54_22 TaxID=1798495 RepID=A0A1F6DMN6_9BACT|nr:MAG: hypothetical protein A3C19_03405 [Candidatus Kaiserbacteria bacterium RIFCSPHIGHO2_02_FULL_54_22]